MFGIERRRYRRYACTINAYFYINTKNERHRGGAHITDISQKGLCCSNLTFYRNDTNIKIERNKKIDLYFTLKDCSGEIYNFETICRVRNKKFKRTLSGQSERVGVEIIRFKNGSNRILRECLRRVRQEKHPPAS